MTQFEAIDDIYQKRIENYANQLKLLKKKDTVFGLIKLSWVVLAILTILNVFSKNKTISLYVFICFVAAFIITALIHERTLKRIRYFKRLTAINENERIYLQYGFPEGSHAGSEFKDSEHNYSSDMDMFGEKSIFHYVNRAVTAVGRKCLATWLKAPASPNEIKKRQEAVMELSSNLDLRQSVIEHGITIDDSPKKQEDIAAFLEQPFRLLKKTLLIGFIYLWPAFTLISIAAIFFGLPFFVFFLFFLSQLAVNKYFFKLSSRLYRLTTKSCRILKAYSKIIGEIEGASYSSEKLTELKKRLSVNNKTASEHIRRLSTLLEWFDTRNGMLHPIVNNIFFLDLHLIYRIEKWRKDSAIHVNYWFEVIGEFETLSSFACLKFNNPNWVMPGICEGRFRIEGIGLGHPLISGEERVCNDIAFGGEYNGSMAIITGPNMAGKSTFLRTVGVNIVFALAGAPVCAERFKISPVKLFTSMQASDSLDKHLSLFYAELQRLKMIIDGVIRNEPVFFIIDEMLKGTNALDRQKGAIALLRQLIRNKANGITATHDLELTKLESPEEWKAAGDEFPSGIQVSNFHFDGYIEDDKLLFDYKLKEGICVSFNALVLMKKMGIDLKF